ncbi:hypothetical protein NA57DRAFT_52904 [Rhizodiscina lignyota]|uniref:CTLH domain-containing protein n=1 Tax=Rhizodiscina lignyota TaxID=1504668 RepID=A0A9P4INX5_9PEZI|nr:hypothetical protein NA57DRAFT_52904 [Rhizodiscina lignyota]
MSTSTVSAATPSKHPFERRVEEVKPSKTLKRSPRCTDLKNLPNRDLNAIIMDYFISEGYPDAARMLAKEANIKPTADEHSISERVAIRNAIHCGDIQSAIERINELNPQILDSDQTLHFSLLNLQLIELIKPVITSQSADPTPALDFATSQLAPRVSVNREFLEDLERTMSLLIFPLESLQPQLARLLQPSLRIEVASKVNEAILQMQGKRREAKIKDLVRLRAWAENKARESKKDIPAKLTLGLDGDKDHRREHEDGLDHDDDDDDERHGNGADIMVH